MSHAASPIFAPPTAQQVQDHLKAHSLRPPPRWVLFSPLIYAGLLALLVFSYVAGGSLALFLAAIAGVIVLSVSTSRRVWIAQRLEQGVSRAQELVLLRHFPQGLAAAWSLLPEVATQPELHGRAVALMAHCLDQMQSYDAALAAMDYLVERLPAESPVGVQVRVQRIIVQLLGDRLSDADEGLRRLRGAMEMAPKYSVAAAAYRLAALIQQTQTNHFADAAATADTLLDDLRPLGVDAGYGHALMALSFHELTRRKPVESVESTEPEPPTLPAPAALWWSKATLLLPVTALRERFVGVAILMDDPQIAAATSSCTPPESEGP